MWIVIIDNVDKILWSVSIKLLNGIYLDLKRIFIEIDEVYIKEFEDTKGANFGYNLLPDQQYWQMQAVSFFKLNNTGTIIPDYLTIAYKIY